MAYLFCVEELTLVSLLESYRSLMAQVLKGMKIKLEIPNTLSLSKTHALFRRRALNNTQMMQRAREGRNLMHSLKLYIDLDGKHLLLMGGTPLLNVCVLPQATISTSFSSHGHYMKAVFKTTENQLIPYGLSFFYLPQC